MPMTPAPVSSTGLSFSAALPEGPAAVLLAALAVAGIAAAAACGDWRRFDRGRDAHLFWGCVTAVAVLWHLQASLPAGSGLHLLGATTACAMFGLPVALVVLAAGIGVQHVADGVPWGGFGPAWLVGALVPAVLAQAVLRAAARFEGRRLGPLPAVAAAFAAGAASMSAVLLVARLVGATRGLAIDPAGFAALALLMATAEANLSASVLAAVAVQRPDWLPATPPSSARAAVRREPGDPSGGRDSRDR
jgi:uncharacterized membrane protein